MLDVDLVAPQPAGDVEAGHVGQPDVEDDRVEAVDRAGELDAGPAVGRELDDVAVFLEESGQGAGEPLVVLDQEQVHGERGSSIRERRSRRWRSRG